MIKNKTVYLTFDVDGLDSSIMPATGTPEPGGLLWDETLDIIRIAAKNSNIVGADINELSPIKGFKLLQFPCSENLPIKFYLTSFYIKL